MKEQKKVIKLTKLSYNNPSIEEPVLIGVDSIIRVEMHVTESYKREATGRLVTQIISRGAMIATTYVKETVVQVWKQINS